MAQFGSVPDLGSGGRGFKSLYSDHCRYRNETKEDYDKDYGCQDEGTEAQEVLKW